SKSAARNCSTLLKYFQEHRSRFRSVIEHGKPSDPMQRPQIRFDGDSLKELEQKWPHAQNDALGYFLWFYCKLARQGVVDLDESALKTLSEFPRYFSAINYWTDQDSGHWEEEQKVSASSIGTVLAGLREFQALADEKSLWSDPALLNELPHVTPHLVDTLRVNGQAALDQILPCESLKPESGYRRYDAALLFLIYPLNVLTPEQGDQVLRDVTAHLQGLYGIRRYLGDSYWFPDYKEKFPAELRTSDSSEAKDIRNSHVRPGQEAQWCIFDSLISTIYGQRRLTHQRACAVEKARESLRLQSVYLNRALSQVTAANRDVPEYRVPEAYYLHHGHYVPNDHTPLYWAQANLWVALQGMERSLSS
ncbi:MAG TPA: hypothetical protein VG326_19745, partial [Tepidisphaeraceae bacterium]|nr:hypothetical protein [Tepidisphaeraceae bacterium]